MNTKDDHQPAAKWEFNADVAEKFNDMLNRSIPSYMQMRATIERIGNKFIPLDKVSDVIDLGASRGESSAPFIREPINETEASQFTDFHLTEISEPMLEVMRARYAGYPNVYVEKFDLKSDYETLCATLNPGGRTSLILSILTLIFVPINYRLGILEAVHDSLQPGGAFILTEKLLGETPLTNRLINDCYHEMKHANGYSWESIERKRLSLEGVQIPLSAAYNEAQLTKSGFKHVECIFRDLNFATWVCVK